MQINEIIGIDVSKDKIDAYIHTEKQHAIFKNTETGIKKMNEWAIKISSCSQEETMFIFEHTGLYSQRLSVTLTELKLAFIPVSGLDIKRSLGISRGKNDKIDSAKIARYGYRLREELEPYNLPKKRILSLKRLLSLRDRLVKQRAGFKASLKEEKATLSKGENAILFETQEKMVDELNKRIKELEKEINLLIKKDKDLKEMFDLIISIKGVGSQTALYMIVYTDGFTKFNNARKFASYCGVAPFPNSSGKSIRGKTKVSHLANKKIKSLLDLCAKSALQFNVEIRAYYHRRVKEGKNKRSTINIVRNKLLGRIFAVIKRGTPYVNTYKYAT